MSVLRAFFGVSMAAATIAVSTSVFGLGPAEAGPDPLIQLHATPQIVRPGAELRPTPTPTPAPAPTPTPTPPHPSPAANLHLSRPTLHNSRPNLQSSRANLQFSPKAIAPQIRTINVIAQVPISLGSAWVNKCAGPVEVTYPGIPPQIVQHDYCGGLWVLGLRTGERIRFVGAMQGVYVVNGQRRVVHTGDPVTLAAGLGDLVAQTCIPGSDHAIQWVGLTRVSP